MENQEKYVKLLQARQFDQDKAVEPEKIYFIIQENVIGTAGNFVQLTGLPKAGKSTFISALVSSAISGHTIWDFRLFLYPTKNKICVFDTEQSQYDFNRTIKRIKQQSGMENPFHRFDSFLVREDDSTDILKMIYCYLLTNPDCGILIVDGLLDLIDNMNDEAAAKKLVKYLRRWAKRFDILIITVLHLGKKDNHSLGHVGSSCDRYAQSTLLIEKTKSGSLKCSAKYLRSAFSFDPIEIYWNQEQKKYLQTFTVE